jgi:hypothetical protein
MRSPGLGWLEVAPLCGLPARPVSGDPAAALPRCLAAVDEAEQRALELGGALVALRRRGFAWVAIARAVDLSLADTLALARHYAQLVAAELVRQARAAGEN